jgi:hypothetical protein
MIARLDPAAGSDAHILLIYNDRKRCKKMMRVPPESSEEQILFYAWFFAAQILPGPVSENGLLNAPNMVLRALTEGGDHEDTPTPLTLG